MAGTLQATVARAEWLDARRVRGYALLVGLASLALLVAAWVQAQGPQGSDFLAFWGGGRAVLAGAPQAAYDLAWQEWVQTGAGFDGWYAFVNPPPYLFVAAPFAALPYAAGWIAWVVLTFAAWAWTSIRAFPRLWPLALTYPGALIAAGHAQNGFVTGALLVGGVALLGRRPVVAGAMLGALVVKPHLALLVPFWLAAGGQWRAFLAAGASAMGLTLASWIAFGTGTLQAYTASWAASRAIMRSADADLLLRMCTPYAQLRHFSGEAVALVAAGLVGLGLLALTMASWRRFGRDPLASGSFMLCATALASPYLFNYDLPFLVLPTLWLVREGLRDGFRDYEKLALIALWFAPYATRAASLPLGINLMPVAAAMLAWLVWTRGRNGSVALG